jgi:hypothetical protein
VFRSAALSTDGRYRYDLVREWLPTSQQTMGSVLFVLLNPSTADAERDDPTVRKCMGFARRWGFVRMVICNLFAYRTPAPGELWRRHAVGEDVVGKDNDWWIFNHASDPKIAKVVAGWGVAGADPHVQTRVEAVRKILSGRQIEALKLTRMGFPFHPARIAYTNTPILWLKPKAAATRGG